jgi:hypothetical protein
MSRQVVHAVTTELLKGLKWRLKKQVKSKVVPVSNKAPSHDDVWGR